MTFVDYTDVIIPLIIRPSVDTEGLAKDKEIILEEVIAVCIGISTRLYCISLFVRKQTGKT